MQSARLERDRLSRRQRHRIHPPHFHHAVFHDVIVQFDMLGNVGAGGDEGMGRVVAVGNLHVSAADRGAGRDRPGDGEFDGDVIGYSVRPGGRDEGQQDRGGRDGEPFHG